MFDFTFANNKKIKNNGFETFYIENFQPDENINNFEFISRNALNLSFSKYSLQVLEKI